MAGQLLVGSRFMRERIESADTISKTSHSAESMRRNTQQSSVPLFAVSVAGQTWPVPRLGLEGVGYSWLFPNWLCEIRNCGGYTSVSSAFTFSVRPRSRHAAGYDVILTLTEPGASVSGQPSGACGRRERPGTTNSRCLPIPLTTYPSNSSLSIVASIFPSAQAAFGFSASSCSSTSSLKSKMIWMGFSGLRTSL
jgi:hypothetical protein